MCKVAVAPARAGYNACSLGAPRGSPLISLNRYPESQLQVPLFVISHCLSINCPAETLVPSGKVISCTKVKSSAQAGTGVGALVVGRLSGTEVGRTRVTAIGCAASVGGINNVGVETGEQPPKKITVRRMERMRRQDGQKRSWVFKSRIMLPPRGYSRPDDNASLILREHRWEQIPLHHLNRCQGAKPPRR
jgi:hypothetical protein